MTSSDDQFHRTQPDDDWTLNERLLVLWDRAAVRWLVAIFVGALIVAVFALMRSTPSESVSSATVTTPGSAPPTASADASRPAVAPPPPTADVIVDVVGPVRDPGVVTLPAGSRVADALAAAGGLTRGKTAINLARVLVDGEQIDVAAAADGAVPAAAADSSTSTSTGTSANKATTSLINLNTATESELEELPRVGPVTAGKIIDFRTQYGGFRSVDQLKEVSGIGAVTFAGIAPLVTV